MRKFLSGRLTWLFVNLFVAVILLLLTRNMAQELAAWLTLVGVSAFGLTVKEWLFRSGEGERDWHGLLVSVVVAFASMLLRLCWA